MTATLASAESAWAVGAGAGLALVLSTALAVALGLSLARFPAGARRAAHALGGVLFVVFGVLTALAGVRGLSG
jgi:putative Ca2+/H+ antiporter (TMEM165/GDT1 family)